jgi:hypothetical protein
MVLRFEVDEISNMSCDCSLRFLRILEANACGSDGFRFGGKTIPFER